MLQLSGDPDCYVEIDTGKIKFNKAEHKLEISRKGVVLTTFQQFGQFLSQTGGHTSCSARLVLPTIQLWSG